MLEIKAPIKITFNNLDFDCDDYKSMIQLFENNVENVRSKLSSFKTKELFDLEIVKKTQN